MVIYDKLRNIETDEKYFDFTCPDCKANGHKKGVFEIKPVKISWKPDMIDNSDILDVSTRAHFNSLPTLREALQQIIKIEDYKHLSFHCTVCNMNFSVYDKINPTDIRKWINKNTEYYMDLGAK